MTKSIRATRLGMAFMMVVLPTLVAGRVVRLIEDCVVTLVLDVYHIRLSAKRKLDTEFLDIEM
jgi:hypothetical protein